MTSFDAARILSAMTQTSDPQTRRTGCCAPLDAIPEPTEITCCEATLFKTLGDPTRLGILKLLREADEPVCVCDLTDRFELNQPTISHHLKLLREAGLVSASRRGTWAFYSLRRERLEEARRALAALLPDAAAV